MAERVADEVGQLGERLDARVTGADEDEAQLPQPLLLVLGGHGGLEAAEDVVAEVDRSRQRLEAERVLGEPGDRQRARGRAERDHDLGVADVDDVLGGLDPCEALPVVDRGHLAQSSSACGHISRNGTTTWRGSSVPDAASGRIGV